MSSCESYERERERERERRGRERVRDVKKSQMLQSPF